MKCSICKQEIEETILGKIKGTFIKINGKLYPICKNCQKKFKDKETLIKKVIV